MYIHTYVNIYIYIYNTYIHTYIHTYIYMIYTSAGPAAKAVPPILVGDLVLTIQGALVKSMDSKQALALLQVTNPSTLTLSPTLTLLLH